MREKFKPISPELLLGTRGGRNQGRKAHRDLAAQMKELGTGKFSPNDPDTETKVRRRARLQRRLHSALRAVALTAKHREISKSELARRMVQCASTHQGRT